MITGIPGKTGVVYTLDRQTGEFLWARPTVMQNVISNIDGATGKVIVNPEVLFTKINEEKFVCPGSSGGKNWPAGAYSPLTNAMYMPMQNMCMNATTTTDTRDPSKVYGINMKQEFAIGADKVGTVWSISAETGQTLWKHEQRAGMLSLMATGGGLVFGGDSNGRFKALDDKTGAVLWESIVGSPASGYPVSFSVGGKQYVAAIVGPSLEANSTRGADAGAEDRQRAEYFRVRVAVVHRSAGLSGLPCGGPERAALDATSARTFDEKDLRVYVAGRRGVDARCRPGAAGAGGRGENLPVSARP